MLSNKLTFSLSFIVMLVLGLAIMASPAFAVPSHDATWTNSVEWLINIYFPIAEDEADGTNPDPLNPKIALEEGGDGLSGIDIIGKKKAAHPIKVGSFSEEGIEADGEAFATDAADVVEFRYRYFGRATSRPFWLG